MIIPLYVEENDVEFVSLMGHRASVQQKAKRESLVGFRVEK